MTPASEKQIAYVEALLTKLQNKKIVAGRYGTVENLAKMRDDHVARYQALLAEGLTKVGASNAINQLTILAR
ncbi:hypothetical protein [Rhizobium sp. BK602]|uniref:hypothetical protein n=1 Tax=Rhizobium sp. BK602 TaxID=2586986 RepID=UPI0016168D3A|nr:hypothetical protein [Rhizobium sp. BK602]MBB3608691.1 hypothetical protein [Rhizobium sp. BK602]